MKVKGLMANSNSYLRSLGEKIRKKIRANLGRSDPTTGLSQPDGPQRSRVAHSESVTTLFGSIAPFVPSPFSVARKMLECAELRPGETLYELGSGGGRIVMMAA